MVILPDPTLQTFGAQIMLRQLQLMQDEVAGVIDSTDIECIHRMRVASRRLRAAQTVFDPIFFRRRLGEWESAIKKVTRSLGAARDLDIQIETIRRFRLMVTDPNIQPGANRLFLRLLQNRASTQKKVIRIVKNFSDEKVIKQFHNRLLKMPSSAETVHEPSDALQRVAAESILEKLDILLSFEPFVDDPERITELHAMRIAAKRMRYTLELFAPLVKDGYKTWLKPLKEIQDLLGYVHDCDVWMDFIPGFIQEEKALTRAYFGGLTGFRKVLPGIKVFLENRKSDRLRRYQEFNLVWHRSTGKNIWEKLRQKVIKSVTGSTGPVDLATFEEPSMPNKTLSESNSVDQDQEENQIVTEGSDENSRNQ